MLIFLQNVETHCVTEQTIVYTNCKTSEFNAM